MIPINIPIVSADRSCNGCTACCEGWLAGSALGHSYWKGRKCHYLGADGCTVYDSRPEDPCQTYHCQWLINDHIPEWMKPNLSNIIITGRSKNGIDWWEITEAGKKMDATVLSWLFMEYTVGNIPNLYYTIDGGWNAIGSQEFLKLITNS